MLSAELRNVLKAVRVRTTESKILQWEIKTETLPTPPAFIKPMDDAPDAEKFVYALWLLGLDSAAQPPNGDAWRLEGVTRLAILSDRMLAARQVFEGIARGELQR